MKTDVYTKMILTVITICLTYNVGKDMELISPAYAVSAPDIPQYERPLDVNIVSVGHAVNVTVKVEAWNAGRINTNIDTWKAGVLPVKVEGKVNTNVESWRVGTVPVKVEDWRAGTLDVRNR